MWQKIPTWFRAVIIGLTVSAVPTLVWAVLATVNLRRTPAIPWSAPAMAIVLVAYWRYLNGAPSRREHLRAIPLSTQTWRTALLAAGSGVAAVWAAFGALRGVLHVTPQLGDVAKFPMLTVAALILMASIVAGVAEEAGFRGFMQLPLERAYGPAVAIATTSILFTLIHLSHGAAVLPFLPFYAVVAVVYGVVTYLTGSILPSVVLHASGDVLMFALQFLTVRFGATGIQSGRIEPVPAFIAIVLVIASVFAFRLLARSERVTLKPAHAV